MRVSVGLMMDYGGSRSVKSGLNAHFLISQGERAVSFMAPRWWLIVCLELNLTN